MDKTILIISGGIEAVPGIKAAKDMGLHVVVGDGNPDAPGMVLADDKIIASTYDIKETVEKAKKYNKEKRPIDGVLCIAADVPLTVAHVAAELGLPGIPVKTAELASDKIAMKEQFRRDSIPIPWFAQVESFKHLTSIVNEKGFPLIIKPVDSRGARGVLKITGDIPLEWAYNHSLENSPTGRVMVEEYLPGDQISTESIIINDFSITPGFADRNYELLDVFKPYIIENGGQQPSHLSLHNQNAVADLAVRAARSLGIKCWTAKGDMVLTKNGPRVIEMATRLSGGWFSTDQIPLSTGIDFIGIAIKLALGEEIKKDELQYSHRSGVAIRYFFPEPGRVVKIDNLEKFSNDKAVHRLCLYVKEGDIVEHPTNHTKRAGFVITKGSNAEEAVKKAEEVINGIQVITESI